MQKNLRFNLSVENLLNANYQVNYDYPMPGLKVKVGAKIDLY
jgi:outer membrane cobalamin receptor